MPLFRSHTPWRRVAALLVTFVAGAWLARSADAHTALRRSSPAKNAHLAAAPRLLSLTFSEAVALPMSSLHLLGPDSQEVALGAVRHPGDSSATIAADVTGALRAGRYLVRWQTAGDDGHPVRGEFAFAIDSSATGLAALATAARDTTSAAIPAAAPSAPADTAAVEESSFDASSPLFDFVRWIGWVALLATVGAVVFRLAIVARVVRLGESWVARLVPTLDRRAIGLGMTAALVLIVASVLELLAESRAAGMGSAFDPDHLRAIVGGTRWGLGWMMRGAGALIALGGLALARREDREGVGGTGLQGWGLAAIGVVTAAFGQPFLGHAGAAPSFRGLAVLADGAHLLGAGGWLGTLLVLLLAGLAGATRLDARGRGEASAALVRAFSPVALTCAALVALSGLIASVSRLGSVGALVSSAYGKLLLLKLAIVAFIVALGALNWRKLGPQMGTDAATGRLHRSATTELVLGALVLAVTSVLAASSPPGYAIEEPDVSQPTRFDQGQINQVIDSIHKSRK